METTTFEKAGLTFTLSVKNGNPCAMATKLLKSGRTQQLFNYRFQSFDRQDEYLNKYIANAEKQLEAKKLAKQTAKEVAKINPFKVGDVLVSSWGYDQTNIDFYQIVEISGQQIKYREIVGESVIGSEGFMCDKVMFVKDEFVSDEVYTKKLVTKSSSAGVYQYVNDPHGHWMSIAEPKGYYRSWYA